jgi:magnesium transporter
MLDHLLAPDIETLLEEGNTLDAVEFLQGLHPTEAAEILTALDVEKSTQILRSMEAAPGADIYRELPPAFQVDVSELLDDADFSKLISAMDPDDRVDLLKSLPKERFEAILRVLAKKERDNIRQLAQYAEGTAGSIMTTEYIALGKDINVKSAIERIRLEGADARSIHTIFVVDAARKLKGSAALSDLILSDPNRALGDIADPHPQTIHALSDREEAVYKFSRYDLVTLPVLDSDDTLIGVITHDDMIDVLEQERTEDMEKFMAISGSHKNVPYLHTSIWSHFKNRVGWLILLAFLGLISGAVLQSFEQTLTSLMILAFYMPMLADTGGNTGSQAATVIVRSLALKEIHPKDALKVIWKEARVALLLAAVLGCLAFARVLLTASNVTIPSTVNILDVGTAIAIALSIQVISSTIIGAILPLAAAALGADPALIASPALTTVVDITGLLIYFTTARLVLRI